MGEETTVAGSGEGKNDVKIINAADYPDVDSLVDALLANAEIVEDDEEWDGKSRITVSTYSPDGKLIHEETEVLSSES